MSCTSADDLTLTLMSRNVLASGSDANTNRTLAEIIHGLLIVESSLLRCNPKRQRGRVR